MTKEDLIKLLNEDLKNERKHLLFYLQAGTMIKRVERAEIGEFFLKEAADEMKHVEEFSRLIVQLGGIPTAEINPFPNDIHEPYGLLDYAAEMEEEVSKNYTERLRMTDEFVSPEVAVVHLFYEDQLMDSWTTAREIRLLLYGTYASDNNKENGFGNKI